MNFIQVYFNMDYPDKYMVDSKAQLVITSINGTL